MGLGLRLDVRLAYRKQSLNKEVPLYSALLSEIEQLEKHIREKVREGNGSRAEEPASSHFGNARSLQLEVISGRLKPERAAELRYNSALCAADMVAKIVRSHQDCRAALDRLFTEFRTKYDHHHASIHHVDNN